MYPEESVRRLLWARCVAVHDLWRSVWCVGSALQQLVGTGVLLDPADSATAVLLPNRADRMPAVDRTLCTKICALNDSPHLFSRPSLEIGHGRTKCTALARIEQKMVKRGWNAPRVIEESNKLNIAFKFIDRRPNTSKQLQDVIMVHRHR